jgi:hypothetical protein
LLDQQVREGIEPFLGAMRRRLERDRKRVHAYHDDLRSAAVKRLAASARAEGDRADAERRRDTLRVEAIEREYRAKVDDLRHNYARSYERSEGYACGNLSPTVAERHVRTWPAWSMRICGLGERDGRQGLHLAGAAGRLPKDLTDETLELVVLPRRLQWRPGIVGPAGLVGSPPRAAPARVMLQLLWDEHRPSIPMAAAWEARLSPHCSTTLPSACSRRTG